MTNAEKLVKDIKLLAKIIACEGPCADCPINYSINCGNETEVQEWLESEAKEDAEIH